MYINKRVPNIIVPKDENSKIMLYENRDQDGDYIIFPICRDDLMELFKSGLFDKINSKVGSLIDFREEEDISDMSKIENCRLVLVGLILLESDPLLKYNINIIYNLFEEAIKFKTGIFFFF